MELVKENNTVQDVKQSIESVLSNTAIKEQAVINAKDIDTKMKSNWFSIEQLMKKTKMKGQQQTHDLLNLLCLFQLAYREEKHGIMKYKITLNVEARKILLIQELEEAKSKVTYLEDEISKLNFINN
jgi:hypothetical protein